MVSSTPRPHFTPGKDSVPILQEAAWAPGPIWTGGKCRIHRYSILDRAARSSVTIPTELPEPPHRHIGEGKTFLLYLGIEPRFLIRPAHSLVTILHLEHNWTRFLSYFSECLNLPKPTGYEMHQQFNIQQLYALLTL